jgi:hypothetical protein
MEFGVHKTESYVVFTARFGPLFFVGGEPVHRW